MATGQTSRVLTLVFTDLVDSTALKSRLGDTRVGELIAKHREEVTRLASDCGGRIIDWAGDGCFLTFETPSAGVDFALRLQRAHFENPELPGVRVGVHLGEVSDTAAPDGARRVEGLAVDLAARIQSLAAPRQVLMSSVVFNSARQRLRGGTGDDKIEWRAHGLYELKGLDEPVEVCEAGFESKSPLDAPAGSEKAHRAVSPGEEDTLGWRPAVGLHVPGRPNWALQEQLGEGGFGEVWLAGHEKTHAKRVFKFCFEPERVKGLKREVVLFRLLRESLGDRTDIAQILDWEFDRPPFFIESEYTEGGDLRDWATKQGGIDQVPLKQRLDLMAQAAEALGAAHSVGVLHKDIKPANILVSQAPNGDVSARLTDFGIGLLTDPAVLKGQGITAAGMTDTLVGGSSSSHSGTRLYMAPEIIEGKPPTTRSDIYSLGVMLYQVYVGNLTQSLAPGWERDVDDEFIRSDIAQCVDGKPEHRFASAEELAERLRSLDARRDAKEREIRERREADEAKRVAAKAKTRRRQFVLVSLVGITITIAVAGLALSEYQRAETQSRLSAELETSNAQMETALADAQQARDEAEYRGYVSSVQLAGARLDQKEISVARSVLLATPADYRGWEWGHLVDRAWPPAGAGESATPRTPGATVAETWSGAVGRQVFELPSLAGMVSGGAFNRNQQVVVTANFTGTARLWSLADGQLINEIGETGGFPMYNVALTSQPPHLITSSDRAVLWDGATGARIASLSPEATDITTVIALNRDETHAAISYSDQRIRVWDTKTGELLATLGDPSEHATSLVFDDSGKTLAVGTGSGKIVYYGWESGSVQKTVTGPATGITVIGPHLKRAATSTESNELVLWSLESALPDATLTTASKDWTFQNNMNFSPDGSVVMWTEGRRGDVRMINAETGEAIATIVAESGRPSGTRFSPDGTFVVAGGQDGMGRVWRAYSESESGRKTIFGDFNDVAYQASVSPDSKRVAAVSYDGTGGVWDIATGQKLFALEGHTEPLGSVRFLANGTRIVTVGLYQETILWDADTGRLIRNIGGALEFARAQVANLGGIRGGPLTSTSAIRTVEETADGRYAGRRTANGIELFNLRDGAAVREIDVGIPSLVFAFDPTRSSLASSITGKGEIKVFDTETGEQTAEVGGLAGQILDLEYSEDGQRLLAGVMDGTARLIDPRSGTLLRTFEGHVGFVFSATFSPDGTRVLTAGADNTARIFDVETGEQVAVLRGHANFVNDAQFSPDGERIMTTSSDASIKIWDLAGNELTTLYGRGSLTYAEWAPDGSAIGGSLTYAEWTPDGSAVVSTWADGKIRVFHSVPWSELNRIGGEDASIEDRLEAWRGADRR